MRKGGLKSPRVLRRNPREVEEYITLVRGVSNPADLTFAVVENPMMYVDSINVVMEEENIDLVMVGTVFPRDAPHLGIFAQMIAEISKRSEKPMVVVCPFASEEAKKDIRMLTEAGIPFYLTAERAAKSINALSLTAGSPLPSGRV